jgi:Domain of unknown function (DUF6438)
MSARLLVALVAGLAGCGHRAPEVPVPDGASVNGTLVTLERGPCFGTCPVYRVSLAGDGTVEFVGTRFVAREGTATSRIAPERVDSLVRSLEAAGYFALADAYVPGAPACGRYATDAPTVVTTVRTAGRDKTVRHDHGCAGAPDELADMERLIDSVAGTARWVARGP